MQTEGKPPGVAADEDVHTSDDIQHNVQSCRNKMPYNTLLCDLLHLHVSATFISSKAQANWPSKDWPGFNTEKSNFHHRCKDFRCAQDIL